MADSPPAPEAPSGSPRGLRWLLTRVLLLLLPLVLLVALAEVALWALGLGDSSSRPPLGRGFDPEAAYLVRDPEVPGGFVTQLFGDPARERHIPPRDERKRVILLGGSNTMLLPERVLQERLDELDPEGPGWDVVNLGRSGYGSARVMILLEQALPRLLPDAVVVYSGHNEFVEAGFRFEVESALGDASGAGLAEAVSQLRLFRTLERAVRPAASPPTDLDPAEDAYGDITWDGTLQILAAYTDNLRRMARACADADVPMLLGTVVGNDWNVPRISEVPAELDAQTAKQAERTVTDATLLVPDRYSLWKRGDPPLRLRVGRWFASTLGPFEPPPVPPHSGPLADMPAWSRGDPREDSVAGAFWPDPAGWKADVRTLVERATALMDPIELSGPERRALVAAEEALREALELMPDHARGLFLLGQVRWLLGEREEAAELLRHGCAKDCAPRRGNATTNARVREVAAEFPGVTLYDAAEEFQSWSPYGLVGYTLMMDGCHLQPGARRVLLNELAPQLLTLLDG